MTAIHLQGATGNQLFCLFAGIAYELKSGQKLIFEESYLKPKKIRHPGGLTDLEVTFEGKKYPIIISEKRMSKIGIKFDRIVFKMSRTYEKLNRLSHQHRSRVIGFDKEFNLQKNYKKVIGFFQTYIYADIVQESLGRLDLVIKNPSNWFNEMSSDISRSANSVAVHIRRGDYTQNTCGIGLLSLDYFYEALNVLVETRKVEKVYIFSDENVDSREFIERFPELAIKTVLTPDESAPIESIILMSLTSYRIISNSSFSWWAAYLSKGKQSNYVPDPWFRNKNVPELLIPDSWIKLKPIWEERADI